MKECPQHGAAYMRQTKASRVRPEHTFMYCEVCKAAAVARGMATKRRNRTDKTFSYAIGPRKLGVQD